jgi:hyaluronan synthase
LRGPRQEWPRPVGVDEARQRAGLAGLVALAEPSAPVYPPPIRKDTRGDPSRYRDNQRRVGGSYRRRHLAAPLRLAPQEKAPGALNESYEIPRVEFRRRTLPAAMLLCALLVVARVTWHLAYLGAHSPYWMLMPAWTVTFGVTTLTLFISWFDKAFTVSPRQQRYLDSLNVTVAIPVYNEDPALLDRCIYSLVNSSRPPECVHAVFDGPSADYRELCAHWTGWWGPTRVMFTQLPENKGKKWAQSEVFVSHPEADIFVTVDSDTTLEYRAIAEGLKPFASPQVASVAGIEEIYNKWANWLTMICAVRNTVSQLIAWSTQSVFGDVLINRGTYALYRARIIREIIPAYLEETFLGHPVKLGDDSALTLFSRAHGKTVQQVTAFCLPMYPETLSHHFRQWLRWARGGSVRNYWRIRYLSVWSWSWWWVAIGLYYIPVSAIFPVLYVVYWPKSAYVLGYIGVIMISWAYAVSPRSLCIWREGENWLGRLALMLMYPVGVVWTSVILRPVRLYGITTCLKQGWVTRVRGVEVAAERDLA